LLVDGDNGTRGLLKATSAFDTAISSSMLVSATFEAASRRRSVEVENGLGPLALFADEFDIVLCDWRKHSKT
jgi:hypothetical protein